MFENNMKVKKRQEINKRQEIKEIKEIKERQERQVMQRKIKNKAVSLKNSRRCTAAFLVGLLFLFYGHTQIVCSQGKDKVYIDEKYRDRIESEYLKELKETLGEFECEQSGITMTKVMEQDKRSYTVLIHNQKINRMDFSEKKDLSDALETVAFIDPDSNFKIEFYAE